MKILRNTLLVLLVVIVLLVIGGVVIFNRWTRGPLPQHDGEITITAGDKSIGAQTVSIVGLTDKVDIIRDSWGIPQIYASNVHDLMFAQGFTQAQDRWWQMEFSRHIGSGSIQELTGANEDVMGQDVFIRTAGWRKAAENDYTVYDEDSKTVLQSFADGVNAYILNRPAGQLAFEYNLLGITGVNVPIQPWTPIDSLVWAKVMAWDLSGNRGMELLRSELYAKLGQEMTDEFIPPYPFDQPEGKKPTILQTEDLPIGETSLTASAADTAGIIGVSTVLAGNITPDHDLFRDQPAIGSNNWVISGSRTESGKPILANDPHLGIGMPSIWYEIGLHCQPVSDACPFEVTGFALPATPGVIIGHNANIAWGLTNVGPDTQDLYMLKINPDNPLQYEWNGEWRDMTTRDEIIKVGDSEETTTITVRETHLGPIINDNQLDENGKPLGFNNVDPMAFKWTATAEPGTILKAIILLNKAANWDDFRNAASYFDVPAQNLIYADIEGNIGYQTPGRIPIRAEGHSGLLPVDGTTDQYEWKGYIPFDDLPRIYNPPRGYIATANQAVVPPEYYDQLKEQIGGEFGENSNYFISQEWSYGYRAERINELINATDKHTIESVQTIQGDDKMISAEEILPALASLDFGDQKYNDARDWLLDWDYQMTMVSQQGGLYGYFWMNLLKNLFDDQLGDIGVADEGDQSMWAVHLLLEKPDDAWWDDVNTADTTETRDDILIRTFRAAYDQISAEQGDNRENWAWGKLHTATFVSNPLGQSGIDIIENMVNRGPYETAGGPDIVNATGFDTSAGNFEVDWLPSMRMVVDLNDLTQSQTMHTTGQSGHPFSNHYADMIDSWREILYHPMLWTPDQVDSAKVNVLVLKPG
ncbi:MAG: penicillin acylase family protein [Chloroflexi bacterium]|nr:penicillin acylase family protein [Chloroflexota bacterium]